jgi:hypothetical protein
LINDETDFWFAIGLMIAFVVVGFAFAALA